MAATRKGEKDDSDEQSSQRDDDDDDDDMVQGDNTILVCVCCVCVCEIVVNLWLRRTRVVVRGCCGIARLQCPKWWLRERRVGWNRSHEGGCGRI